MARTPLLLTLLCLAFDETGYFPKRRVDLYEEALTALLQKWDASRGILRDEAYKKLSPKRKRQMFARVAHATFERGDYFLREEPLARQIAEYLHHVPPVNQDEEIDGKVVLKAIEAQHGILIERARGIYSFSHLTFQEYFTALYIVDNAGKETLPKLMAHISDPRWREVLLMVASLLDDADDFFAFFRFALETLIAEDETVVALMRWATHKAASMDAPYQPAALRSFYLSRALALALDRVLDRVLALDRVLDRARARALDRDLKADLLLNYSLEFTQIFSFSLHHEAIRALVPALAVYFEEVRRACAPFPALHQALASLPLPPADAPADRWSSFAADLRALLIRERDIGHEWQLQRQQSERLEAYLEANFFLLQCLALASVAPERRRAIEDSLLLPPGHPPP